jgi:SAM-dependent methyltransferase
VTPAEAAQHFVLLENSPERHAALKQHIVQLWGANRCIVRRCEECAFGFADPYVAGDVTFYNLAYERVDYPTEKWEFDRTLQDFKMDSFSGRRVLETGAGQGLFLDKIVDRYVPRSGITALEFNDTSLAVLKAKGYEARQEDIREADLNPGFDAIFLFQVVEHMDRLDSLFQRIHRLLAPRGRAYIAVPNPRRTDFNEKNRSLLDMPPNHIGRWSSTAFERVGQRSGLAVDAIETEPFSFTEFVRQDIVFSYLRRAQVAGSLANLSLTRRSRMHGKFLGAAIALLFAPLRAPIWVEASQARDMGASLWARLSRAPH